MTKCSCECNCLTQDVAKETQKTTRYGRDSLHNTKYKNVSKVAILWSFEENA